MPFTPASGLLADRLRQYALVVFALAWRAMALVLGLRSLGYWPILALGVTFLLANGPCSPLDRDRCRCAAVRNDGPRLRSHAALGLGHVHRRELLRRHAIEAGAGLRALDDRAPRRSTIVAAQVAAAAGRPPAPVDAALLIGADRARRAS